MEMNANSWLKIKHHPSHVVEPTLANNYIIQHTYYLLVYIL